MDILTQLLDLFLHLDTHLGDIITQYGTWTYAILFCIVFAETGLVVAPFLPGDSLLFAAGLLAAATGALDPWTLIGVLVVAAILGDTVNYSIGAIFGNKVLQRFRFIKREHVEYTEKFYERHGGKTIIFARFAPIVRTFAPFVAGIGAMNYTRFVLFNIVGGIAWVTSFVLIGYFFGNVPIIKRNFSLIIIAIVILSTAPAIIEFLRHRFGAKKA
jgi:membrane-associated protein